MKRLSREFPRGFALIIILLLRMNSLSRMSITHSPRRLSLSIHCFIQINLAGESTKSGFSRAQFELSWPRLADLKGLRIVGLMTMPPLENEPEKNRAFFRELKYIGTKFNLHEFSMGTSHDYQIALEEGATWIRLGTMLFGERQQKRGPL